MLQWQTALSTNPNLSPAQALAKLPQEIALQIVAHLSDKVCGDLAHYWQFWSRPNQRAPLGDWLTWLILAGRGFGKTRSGSEWVRSLACGSSPLAAGTHSRFALVAETAADTRDVLVEGDSGILSVHPKDFRPTYEPSKRRLTWPNGAVATLYNGTEPDQLRGPQHDAAWVDELAKFDYAQETWDMLQFGLRLGTNPRQLVTTTPRPIPLLKALIKASNTVVSRGSTLDNASHLAPSFLQTITDRYGGTRLGRQELEAEMLDDLPGALWNHEMIDQHRVHDFPELNRIVVAVDPSGTKGEHDMDKDAGDDIGIAVVGKGIDGRGYVLADMTCNLSPLGWGKRAVAAYEGSWYNSRHPAWPKKENGDPAGDDNERFVRADMIVGERNFGGAMVQFVVSSAKATVPFKEVVASRGKVARAEPVAALYEQGRISHVGTFPEMEDQMCLIAPDGYAGEGSPDRADAVVWALTELFLDGSTYTLANL